MQAYSRVAHLQAASRRLHDILKNFYSLQVAASLLINLLSLAVPILMLQVYDRIIPRQSFSTLIVLVFGVLIAVGFETALRLSRGYASAAAAKSYDVYFTRRQMMRILGNPAASTVDGIVRQLHQPANASQNPAARSTLRQGIYADMPFVFIFMGLVAWIGGWLVVPPLILMMVYVTVVLRSAAKSRVANYFAFESAEMRQNAFVSVFCSLPFIKTSGHLTKAFRHFEATQIIATRAYHYSAAHMARKATQNALFTQMNLLLTVCAGGAMAASGLISIGALSACTLLAGRALPCLQRGLEASVALLERHQNMDDDIFSGVNTGGLPPVYHRPQGHLVVQGLAKKQGGAFMFRNLSFAIDHGTCVNLQGNGASPLLHILAGLEAPHTGIARIDGFCPRSAMGAGHTGYLPQNTSLLKGTIRENMTGFAKEPVFLSFTDRLSRAFGLEEAVHQLADGYDTRIDDDADGLLSQGLVQRIALVRALRTAPRLVLLDTPDQYLDSDGYFRLYHLLQSLKGKATIVLATRNAHLSQLSDRVIDLQTADAEYLSAEHAMARA